MKRSGNGGRHRGQKRIAPACTIVDGYNVLGKTQGAGLEGFTDFEAARRNLIEQLKEYRSFTGDDVIVVFDGHHVRQRGNETSEGGVRVIYTGHQETADDCIERLVYDLRDVYRQIRVATSDFAEQQVAFGGGALRISAGEFLRILKDTKRGIRQTAEDSSQRTGRTLGDSLRQDIANILEKWRKE